METIPAPIINTRKIKVERILLSTVENAEEIMIICTCTYLDQHDKPISASTINLAFKKREQYEKDGKLYNMFDKAYNYLFPKEGISKSARDHIFEKSRDLIKEFFEVQDDVAPGTYNKVDIPDPESVGDVEA